MLGRDPARTEKKYLYTSNNLPRLGFSALFILDLESRLKILNSAHTHTNHTYNRSGDAILGFSALLITDGK